MDLCRRQPIWLQPVRCLVHNNGQMRKWEHQIIILVIHRAMTLNSGNLGINFIQPHHQGIAMHLRSHNFQALPSSTTRLHSTSQQAHNHTLVQPKDIWVMGDRSKHMISPKEVMVDLKCSPLSNSHDMGHHLQAQLECIQHRLETIQSSSRPLLLPLRQDNFPAALVDLPLASQQNNFSRLQNPRGQMLPGVLICLHWQRYPMKNTMQIMRATICRTWAGPKKKPQSA